jgi:hypothetical protein
VKDREGALEGIAFPLTRLVARVFCRFSWGMEKRPGLTRNVARNFF